jgi:hypothetical protein
MADPFINNELDKIASRQRVPDHDEWQTFERHTKALLWQEKFTELEKLAVEIHNTKPRFQNGEWVSARLYDSLRISTRSSEAEWREQFARIDRWIQAIPYSATAKVVLARTYFEYGWHARGGGYKETVSKEGWKLLGERLEKARQILDGITTVKRDVEWDRLMLMIKANLGDLDGYQRTLEKAIAQEPNYDWFYKLTALYSLPRWYGHSNEWVKATERFTAQTNSAFADEMYTRVIWHVYDTIARDQMEFSRKFFDENQISWTRMKQGFRDMEKRYPNSLWNLNSFCRFACMNYDYKTAGELFNRMGDNWDIEMWYHRSQFTMFKQVAHSPVSRPPPCRWKHLARYGWIYLSAFFGTMVILCLGYLWTQKRQRQAAASAK